MRSEGSGVLIIGNVIAVLYGNNVGRDDVPRCAFSACGKLAASISTAPAEIKQEEFHHLSIEISDGCGRRRLNAREPLSPSVPDEGRARCSTTRKIWDVNRFRGVTPPRIEPALYWRKKYLVPLRPWLALKPFPADNWPAPRRRIADSCRRNLCSESASRRCKMLPRRRPRPCWCLLAYARYP